MPLESTELKEATSNLFIIDFLNQFKWKQFCGVFASNTIPEDVYTKKEFSIICNLSRYNEEGTHFVSIIKYNNTILYLDPLALYIDLNDDINTFIYRCNCENVLKLQRPIQDMNSWYCGYFCIFFVLFFNRELECRKELTPFVSESEDLIKNDCICLDNIMLIFNECQNK